MSNTANPFEPPRSDLGGGPAPAAAGTDGLPEEALTALIQTTPWARWSVRLTLFSTLLTAIHAMVTLGKTNKGLEVATTLISAVAGLIFALLWVMVAGRYASHASRLPFREHRAVVGVMEAQRGIFRMVGVMTIGSMILFVGIVILGFMMVRSTGAR